MSDQDDEIAVRLAVYRELDQDGRPKRRGKWWLAVPIEVEQKVPLALVINTIATRSVITPPALERMRQAGLSGADILTLGTRRQDFVIRNVRLGGHLIPEFAVQVRHVPGLQIADGRYLVDGYIGLDVLFGSFSIISVDTRRRIMTVRLN